MTRNEFREAVARAIETADNLRVPDGHADNMPDDISDWAAFLADAALAVALPILREHYAGVAEANTDNVTGTAYAIAAAIRADEGPK